MPHGSLFTISPLAPDYSVDPVVHISVFVGDDGALLNIAVRGDGGSLHNDTDVGSSLHTDHKHVANFLPAPVKTHIREYVFVAVAINKSRPMHQGYWFKRWPSLHTFRILPDTSASRRGRKHAFKAVQAAAAAATDVG